MTIVELLLPPTLTVAGIFAGYQWGQQDLKRNMIKWFRTGNTNKLIEVLGGDYWRITKL